MVYHLRAQGDFYPGDGFEQQFAQGCVEIVEPHGILKSGSRLELVGLLVRFHRPEIVGKPEITDGIQYLSGSGFITDGKPTVF